MAKTTFGNGKATKTVGVEVPMDLYEHLRRYQQKKADAGQKVTIKEALLLAAEKGLDSLATTR
jgi:hypothetical protein